MFGGGFLKFSTYLFRCVNMPLGKWMIKLHFSSLNFVVILMTVPARREFFLQRQSILSNERECNRNLCRIYSVNFMILSFQPPA